jgi:hypothetical protein
MQVSLSKHDNRTALKIESGYRKGNLMGDADGYVMHFSTDAAAIKWASETGYVVVLDESDKIDSKEEYQKLLDRKCNLPEGCKIYAWGTPKV